MAISNDQESTSRRLHVMMVLCQIMGLSMYVGLATTAVTVGATGYILCYIVSCLLVGIPLLYMEFIVSQFTARDCIDVWKVRPCVSHVGYILVLWQVIHILYNHVLNAFTLHYLLISFENPIPYYTCGRWSSEYCNILVHNLTVNDDCIRIKERPKYCDNLHTTFPEYQYWRYKIMGTKSTSYYHIAWRVCLASAVICAIMYLSVVRRKRSVAWVAQFFAVFPLIGYVILLMGSMLQKGIVTKYDDALDSDFSDFVNEFRISRLILNVVYTLGIGSGVAFNLACDSPFRAPLYSNTVVTVVVVIGASILAICFSAMMSCPYAHEYGIDPNDVMKASLSLLYEKTPRFLYEYQYKSFYLVLVYSCHTVLGTGTNVIYVLHMVEMATARSAKIAKYPGLTAFLGILCIFFISMPLMCNIGIKVLVSVKRHSCVLSLFVAVVEIAVFVIWYGVDKFSEDVHFMLGLQPKNYLKASWVSSIILLSYAFFNEAYKNKINHPGNIVEMISWYLVAATAGLIIVILIFQLLIAACRKKLYDVILLDSNWGPKSEVLQRSRAMFTAQAMTKEYLYRQYHLQAGIMARQNLSNRRSTQPEMQL